MTPEQLDELEVWLAAGFDPSTAMAAVQGDGSDEPIEPPLAAPAAKPSARQVVLCVFVALTAMRLVLR
jgi:hypothetical protein